MGMQCWVNGPILMILACVGFSPSASAASGDPSPERVMVTHQDGTHTVMAVPAAAAASPARGGGSVNIPIVNPGAESGNLAGWSNPGGYFFASNSAAPPGPSQGAWFFDSTQYLNFDPNTLRQTIDISAYAGQIQDIVFTKHYTAAAGSATQSGSTYEYWIGGGVGFMDAGMSGLGGGGFVQPGTDPPSWTVSALSGSLFGNWDDIRRSVHFVEIGLNGFWLDQNFNFGDPPPGSTFTNVPETTRWDALSITLHLCDGPCRYGDRDADGDGDIDLADLSVWQECLSGPDAAPNPASPPPTAQECLERFDAHRDNDVDLADFAVFQDEFTGALCGNGQCVGNESCAGCPADCGECPGACCDAYGFCYEDIAENCADPEYQTFHGPGSFCGQVTCHTRTGACCEDEFNCYEDLFQYCSFAYFGDGSFCSEVDCADTPPTLGACCTQELECLYVTFDTCNNLNGSYQGDFVTCDSVSCNPDVGACCVPFEDCVDQLPAECDVAGGYFVGAGTSCAVEGCPSDVGVCCQNSGGCLITTPDECFNNHGGAIAVWPATCESFECPAAGACCHPDGCMPLLEGTCEFNEWDYLGDDVPCSQSACDACPGPGSCFSAHGNPSCDDSECCTTVCGQDPSCCSGNWSAACAALASNMCRVPIVAGPIVNPANGHEYYLLERDLWPDAEQTAVLMGGHLATIENAAEDLWVRDNVVNFGGEFRDAWIGLNDAAVEGTFVWVATGAAATYFNWDTGEPNDCCGGEDHVELRGFQAKWNDTLPYLNLPPYAVVEVP